jgi:hypothetical protein
VAKLVNNVSMQNKTCATRWHRNIAVVCSAILAWCALTVHAQTPAPFKLRVVGGLAGLSQFTRWEEPFWTQELQRLSGGKYSADIVPFDRAGVPGVEMLRLLQLGVVPFGTTLLSSLTAQFPQYTAPDLAGLNPDIANARRSLAVFRPYLEKSLREQHGIEALAFYTYPAQVVFCKAPISNLSELSGRRVRVSSAGQADFIGALGGTPVNTAFAQMVGSFKAGNIDCAITGTLSGFTVGLPDMTRCRLHGGWQFLPPIWLPGKRCRRTCGRCCAVSCPNWRLPSGSNLPRTRWRALLAAPVLRAAHCQTRAP